MAVILVILLLIILFMMYVIFFLYRAFIQKNVQYDKVMSNFLLLYDWMEQKQNDPDVLVSSLQKKGYDEILIYGWGYLGHLLCRELEHTRIKVKGVLDRRCLSNTYDIPSYRLQDDLPKVGAVILTVLHDEKKIRNDIDKIIDCPVISLEDLV